MGPVAGSASAWRIRHALGQKGEQLGPGRRYARDIDAPGLAAGPRVSAQRA